jgi:uncharacterized protein YyaL (SSP411 family)
MAITWRQHIKNTMATMGKKTHLKDVLKAASKTWKSVKKDVSGAAPAAAAKSRRARKGSRKNKKTRRSTRRSRRGGAVVAYSADQLQGGLKGAMVTGSN